MKGGGMVVIEEGTTNCDQETYLTVMKTSLFFAGDGFTVYDCSGQLVYRVDSYGGPDIRDRENEVVLMDPAGRCLLTVRRKEMGIDRLGFDRPSLHQRWEGYRGERSEGSKPIFSVRRSSIIGRSGVTVETYDDPGVEYQVEGCFSQRSCTVYEAATRSVVAEIRRKVDASSNVVLGKDVFSLRIKPGCDGAFVMGVVLVLDQISAADGDAGVVVPVSGDD